MQLMKRAVGGTEKLVVQLATLYTLLLVQHKKEEHNSQMQKNI